MLTWTPGVTLQDIERSCIMQALRYFNGNTASVGRSLGISDRTVRKRIDEYKAQDRVREMRSEATHQRNSLKLKLQRGQISDAEYEQGLRDIDAPTVPGSAEEGDLATGDLGIPTPEARRAHG